MISPLNSDFDSTICRGIFSFRGNVYSVNILGSLWVVVFKYIRTWSPRCGPLGSKSCFRIANKNSILFRRIRGSKSTLCSKFWKFSKTKFTSRFKWGQTKCVRSRIWTVQTIHRIKLTNIMVFNISKLKIRQNCSVLNLKYTRFRLYFWIEILR